jgi:FkbM family methyltransferase
MGSSQVLKRALMSAPGVSAPLLRAYLRSGVPVPSRLLWLADALKRELPLSWTERMVRLPGGGRLRIDSRSAVGREIYYGGSYEPAVSALLRRLLKPGMVFFDVGANIGEFTALAGHCVGRAGQVHAFEASPRTFSQLVDNVALNRLQNVRLVECAVSSDNGVREFFLSPGIASGSSSLAPAHDYSGQSVKVRAVTLDSYVEENGVPSVNVVKLDIEGAELEAVKGASRLLERDRPTLIVEYHPEVARRFGVDLADLTAALESHRYRLFEIQGARLRSMPGVPSQPTNVLALPEEHSARPDRHQ